MNKTAIVLGATGLVGRSLVEQLARADHVDHVVTITRRPAPSSSIKVINHVVNFDHLDDHASLFNAEYLFSSLGTTRKQAGSVDAQRKVDVDYQFAAAQLAARNGVRHYLLVSSTGADANTGNAYLKMKGELEERVLQLPFERISIFQPSVLIGERDEPRVAERLSALVLQGLRFFPGLRRYRPIRAEQVAAKMVQASNTTGPARQWFQLDDVFPD